MFPPTSFCASTNFAYDTNQNLSSTTAHLDSSTAVTTAYTYNSFGEPLTVTDPLGNGHTKTNAYDANDNLTSVSSPSPDGSTNTYAYDTLNRLSTLTDSGAGQFTIGYDALSRRTQMTRPNGVTTSYGYDPVSHLQSI